MIDFYLYQILLCNTTFVLDPVAQSVECPLRGTGCHGFESGPRHTKVVNKCTRCSSLGTQTYGVELELVDPVSGWCFWVWCHVKYLGHDTLVRQHYKSEHWAPFRNQTPSWYDWKKNVESAVKLEQTNKQYALFFWMFNHCTILKMLQNRSVKLCSLVVVHFERLIMSGIWDCMYILTFSALFLKLYFAIYMG